MKQEIPLTFESMKLLINKQMKCTKNCFYSRQKLHYLYTIRSQGLRISCLVINACKMVPIRTYILSCYFEVWY